MRRNQIILFTLLLLPILLGMGSCTKAKPADTPYDRIQGKWKKVKYGLDDNNDKTFQAREIHWQPPQIDDEVTFNSDGTGKETTTSNNTDMIVLSFVWKVTPQNKVWVAYKTHDTVTYSIYRVNSENLELWADTYINGVPILASFIYSNN